MVKASSYMNLTELLPACFKTENDIEELLTKLDLSCRLLQDQAHLCSKAYLQKCLEQFVQASEAEAIKLIKKGMGPDKLARMNLNEKPKAKPTGKGKKKGKQVEEQTVDTSNLDSEALIRINPLKIADL